jgi:methylmalonyl-CoA/ethylmalonyl-CoA epimerase
MTTQALFRKVLQVGLVVKDSEATARRYWDEFGIGPWRFYTLDPANTSNMRFRGRPVEHAFRAALADLDNLTLELIEPLDGASVYSEHLRLHGEGLHHLAFAVDDYDTACNSLVKGGFAELQAGRPYGVNDYSYFDTAGALGFITEIYSKDAPGKSFPPPELAVPSPTNS